jgi:hypothetical protein
VLASHTLSPTRTLIRANTFARRELIVFHSFARERNNYASGDNSSPSHCAACMTAFNANGASVQAIGQDDAGVLSLMKNIMHWMLMSQLTLLVLEKWTNLYNDE